MKLLDRYMSAVAHYLPEKRRDEIARELRSNILDQLEQLAEPNHSPSEAQVAQVLNGMGHPQKVANQFLPPKRLVSEELFPLYTQVLGYALLIVFLVELIKLSVALVSNTYMPTAGVMSGYMLRMMFGLAAGFITQGLLVFAIVTGVFYVLSNPPGGKPLLKPYRCWRAEQLPPVVYDWQRIRACHQASEIALNIFVLLIIYHQIWIPETELQKMVMQLTDTVSPWLNLLGVVMLVTLFFNHWNIRFDFWTKPKLIFNILLNSVSAVIFIVLSRLPQIFLPGEKLATDMVGLVDVVNAGFKIGFLIMGLYLLYEIGRDMYRVVLLNRADLGLS